MYLDNPKKLFNDLYNIDTMYDYMVACAEDGMQDDLNNLISIVYFYHGCLNDGDMNGSLRWDLSQCETEKEREQMLKDDKTMTRIWRTIQKELRSKYVIVCPECNTTVFYGKKPKYEIENYYCYKCRYEHLELYPLQSWLDCNNIQIDKMYKEE